MQRPTTAREALRLSPLVKAGWANASGVERIPRRIALTEAPPIRSFTASPRRRRRESNSRMISPAHLSRSKGCSFVEPSNQAAGSIEGYGQRATIGNDTCYCPSAPHQNRRQVLNGPSPRRRSDHGNPEVIGPSVGVSRGFILQAPIRCSKKLRSIGLRASLSAATKCSRASSGWPLPISSSPSAAW
jgi:hypothetical protein